MKMGVEPPFIYDRPSSYSFAGPTTRPFDPRAATRASWQPRPPKPKPNGPLVDFNKHPDSYLIVPYGNLNVEPMDPKTKPRVKRLRRVQLFFRSCQFLGAIGLLFCVIAINKTTSAVGWIIRIGPAVALCHTFYAIYHLCRDAAGRSPSTTASYMMFAGIIDTGLIPFFAFSGIMAYQDDTTNAYGWSTLFSSSDMSYKVIHAFYLLNLIEAGMIGVSLLLDVYLAIVFRKIAKMPPDMNPLEDNLTARPFAKHKRNKSELVFDKHLSSSTLATQRLSQTTDPSNMRRIPFQHTRTDSADRLTLYGNEKAHDSRVSLRKEFDTNSQHRDSLISSPDTLVPSRPTSAVTPAENARQPGAGLGHKPIRSSGLAHNMSHDAPSSWLSYTNHEGAPSLLSETASRDLDGQVRPLSPVSALSEHDYSPERSHSERQNWFHSPGQYAQLHSISTDEQLATPALGDENAQNLSAHSSSPRKRSRDPLGMNPPTPVQSRFQSHESMSPGSDTPRPPLQETSSNTADRPGVSSRTSSFFGSGRKDKYYGNLRSSLGGSQQHYTTHDTSGDEDLNRSNTFKSESSANFEVYDSDSDHEGPAYPADVRPQPRPTVLAAPRAQEWSPRKTSATTGYDLKSGYAGLGADFGLGMARRREVSGKVAEEGRGGDEVHYGYGGLGRSESQDGGVVTGQKERGGAAGWARFKGL